MLCAQSSMTRCPSRRAGEGDLVDQRVGGHRFSDHRPETSYQVEDALRQTDLVDDLGQDEGVDRSDLARLQNHRASRRQRRRDLEDDLVEGEVPRRDGTDDTDGLLDNKGVTDLLLPVVRRSPGGVIGELPYGQPHLKGLGEAPRHPHFMADHVGNLAGTRLEPFGHLLEVSPTVLGRCGRPPGEGPTRRLDCSIDIGWGPGRDRGEHLLGGRVDDVQCVRPGRRDPSSVDVKRITNDHGHTS